MIIISIEENNNSAVVSCRNQFNYHKELVVIDAEVIAVAGRSIFKLTVGTGTGERLRTTTRNIPIALARFRVEDKIIWAVLKSK